MPKEKNRKSEKKKKAGKKTSQLAIRVEKSERDAFVELCDTLDTSAAREIRRFMRDFVETHPKSGEPAQTEDTPAGAEPAADVPVTTESTTAPAKPKRTTATRKTAAPSVTATTTRAPRAKALPSEGSALAAPARLRRTARAKPPE